MNRMKRSMIGLILTMLFSLMFSILTFADWQQVGGRYRYFNSAINQYVVNNWLQTGGGYYYLDAQGYAVTGWYLINGKYYYFNKDCLMQTGFIEVDGKNYYLNPQNGQMVTGWIQIYSDGVLDYYYFDENGAQVTGWKEIDGKWYYFYDGKALVDTWAKVNDIWYHFNTAGYMDTGWIKSNGKMYFLNISNGALTKGWIQDQQGNEYYLSDYDGSLTIGCTVQIYGKYYTFDDRGRCIAKDQTQYSVSGDIYGNTGSYTVGVLGNKGSVTAYGVNVGVSPGQNQIQDAYASTSTNFNQNVELAPGSTTGPK